MPQSETDRKLTPSEKARITLADMEAMEKLERKKYSTEEEYQTALNERRNYKILYCKDTAILCNWLTDEAKALELATEWVDNNKPINFRDFLEIKGIDTKREKIINGMSNE